MVISIIKFFWILLSLFILYITLDAFGSMHDERVMDVLDWLMLILSFPTGLAASATHYAWSEFSSITIATSYLSLALEWLAYFILGYLQWFVLMPWLWRKWNARGAK